MGLPAAWFAERALWNIWPRSCGSLGLNVGGTDHFAPLLGLICDELGEVGGRHRHRHAANVGEPCLNLGIGEARIELSVELIDDLGRRALRCADAVPGARLIAW